MTYWLTADAVPEGYELRGAEQKFTKKALTHRCQPP